jgi:hypothetical protein
MQTTFSRQRYSPNKMPRHKSVIKQTHFSGGKKYRVTTRNSVKERVV